MGPFSLTHKDLLELKFWLTCNIEQERKNNKDCIKAFGIDIFPRWLERPGNSVLEVGTGPTWGVLPCVSNAHRRVAVDPLIDVFDAVGILEDRQGIHFYSEAFEKWDTNDKFDAIFCINSLDHGEMGFHLMPKFSALLKSGGHLFIHVDLRPPELLNLIHDHSLTIEQLDRNLSFTDLIELKRMTGVDGELDCLHLAGIWRKP